MIKKERKIYGLLPPKIAETVTQFLNEGGTHKPIFNMDTIQNTLSDCIHNDGSRLVRFEIFRATNKLSTSIQDLFHKPYWHITCNLNLSSLTMGVMTSSNVHSKTV
jgi:hypothetical protein